MSSYTIPAAKLTLFFTPGPRNSTRNEFTVLLYFSLSVQSRNYIIMNTAFSSTLFLSLQINTAVLQFVINLENRTTLKHKRLLQ